MSSSAARRGRQRKAGCAPWAALSTSCVAGLAAILLALPHPYRIQRAYTRDVALEKTSWQGADENTYLQGVSRVLTTGEAAVMGQEKALPVPGTTDKLWIFPAGGWLVEVDLSTNTTRRVQQVGGRVLGAAVYPPARHVIIACDVTRGLVAINLTASTVTVLVDSVEGRAIRFCDDVDVAADGTAYFTDAMDLTPQRLPSGDYDVVGLSNFDFYRGKGSARFVRWSPTDPSSVVDASGAAAGHAAVLLRDLYFANGVAVTRDQQAVLITETFNQRVLRYWIAGPRAGSSEIALITPCLPDGVSLAADGGFWVACPVEVDAVMYLGAKLQPLRWLLGNLPRWMQPPGQKTGTVLKLAPNARLEYVLRDPSGSAVHFVTAVTELNGRLYLGQLLGAGMPIITVPQ